MRALRPSARSILLFAALAVPGWTVLPAGTMIACHPDAIVIPAPALQPGETVRFIYRPRGGHVPEDLELVRPGGFALGLAGRLTGPHGLAFSLEGGLARRFLFPLPIAPWDWATNQACLVKAVVTKLSNLGGGPRLPQWAVGFSNVDTSPVSRALERVTVRLTALRRDLEALDTAPLRRGKESRLVPLRWTEEMWETNRSHWGLGSLECLGGGGDHWVYRMGLTPADTDLARRENSAAHGYFLYIREGESMFEILVTSVAFSVYNK